MAKYEKKQISCPVGNLNLFRRNNFLTLSFYRNKLFLIRTSLILIFCLVSIKCLSSNSVIETERPANTVAYFSFDSHLNDLSGNSNDGKVIEQGKVVFAAGTKGQCFDVSQGTLKVSTKGIGKGSSGTIEMMVKFSDFKDKQILWSFYGLQSNSLSLEYNNNNFMLKYYQRDKKIWSNYAFPLTDERLNTNEWFHLLLSWDNMGDATGIALLINGKIAGRSDKFPKIDLEKSDLFIGYHNGKLNAHCLIDEFRFSKVSRYSGFKMISPPLDIAPLSRKRLTDRTYFFARSQSQYNLYMNYIYNHHLYKYNDRPLFYNRDLWQGKNDESFESSILHDMQILRMYGIDGMGVLVAEGSKYNHISCKTLLDAFEKIAPQDIKILLECTPSMELKEKSAFIKFVEIAMKNPAAFRLNGKLMVTSYCADFSSPEQIKGGLDFARQIYGDKFIFIADIRVPKGISCKSWPAFEKLFHDSNGAMATSEVDAFKQYLRNYLDVCDGIMFAGSNHTAIDNHFYEKFYRDFLIPCFKSVLSEPKYRNKYFGLSASVGYVNQFSGVVKSHDGTRQLRQSIEAALDAEPDFINIPEWNEFNENTCLQPTTLSSMASQRILKYYTSKSKGLELLPNPGDAPLMPDLILSTPAAVNLGDRMYIELLNVPDSSVKNIYEVSVVLTNNKGKIVQQFPIQQFDAGILQEKRLYFPTENAGDSSALLPQIEIKTAAGNKFNFKEGLYPVMVRPGWNWNYSSVRQPLQDIAHISKCEFSVSEKSGKTIFRGAVKCDEPISTLELLEDENPIFAVDPNEEFKLKENEALIFINWNCCISPNSDKAEVAIEVENGEIRHMSNMNRGIGSHFEEPLIRTGKSSARLPYYNQNFKRRRGGFFIITNKDKAVLKTTVTSLPNCNFSLPVKQITEAGVYSKKIALSKHFMVRFESTDKLLDIPMLNKSEADFAFETVPLNKNSVYNLRLITVSGKIYRSKPLILNNTDSATVELHIYSDTEKQVVPVKVDARRIPDIKYTFNDCHGNILTNNYGYNWNAELGGGFAYGGPYSMSVPPAVPGPVWVKKDGEFCLKFDGKGNYINFPHAVFPLRSGFTVIFEIYPESDNKQYLLNVLHGYRLMIEKGELTLQIMSEDGKLLQNKTGLKLPVNQWSKISVIYFPAKGFYVKVNENYSPLILFDGRCQGLYNQAVFGALGKTCFFEGLLKSFQVTHTSVTP